MSGLYIHIPFCKSRCIYCGFYSTTHSELITEYVSAVCSEAMMRRDYLDDTVETIYLGGGTPSQLPQEELRRLLIYINKVYPIAADAEITVECNPDDVTPQLAETLVSAGVNRVSMGAQTFSDARLKLIRRRHNAVETANAVSILRRAGIRNISLDLMFGFPGETLPEWNRDIDAALSLNVEHISTYSLMYEEGTQLHRMLSLGQVKEVDEELSLAMYNQLIDRLEASEYEHYEISNFALPGFRSRHNSSYWHAVPYLGLGAAAHSYNLASRQWNVSNVRAYIQAINGGTVPCEVETLDEQTRYNDLITTMLRTSDGLSLEYLNHNYGATYLDYCLTQAAKNISQGLLEITPDSHLRLTRKGLFLSDSVMSDLIKV